MITATISTSILSGTVIAAVIGAIVNAVINRKKFLEEERARARTTYPEAMQAVAAYRELPYAIRRSRRDDPVGERIRLSEMGREIQQRLAYYRAWIQAESSGVGAAYAELVRELRAVAGAACHRAWTEPAIQSDADMNISTDKVDLRSVIPLEEAYTRAVTEDLRSRGRWRTALSGRRNRNT
jgi:hypothetical protein